MIKSSELPPIKKTEVLFSQFGQVEGIEFRQDVFQRHTKCRTCSAFRVETYSRGLDAPQEKPKLTIPLINLCTCGKNR